MPANTQPHILMCPPTYFAVDYAINAWMDTVNKPNLALAQKQWEALHEAIAKAGAKVSLLPAQPGMPDLVFTANAGIVRGNKVVLARYRHPERQMEEPIAEIWFREQGYTVIRPPAEVYFEGEGDALQWGNVLFSGYGMRSDIRIHRLLFAELGIPTFSLSLMRPKYYHVDVCMCPLPNGDLIYYPDALDPYDLMIVEAMVPYEKRIAVSPEDAELFACNAVPIGNTVILNAGAHRLTETLEKRGFTVVGVELGEFIKAGGAAKCMTLEISRQ